MNGRMLASVIVAGSLLGLVGVEIFALALALTAMILSVYALIEVRRLVNASNKTVESHSKKVDDLEKRANAAMAGGPSDGP